MRKKILLISVFALACLLSGIGYARRASKQTIPPRAYKLTQVKFNADGKPVGTIYTVSSPDGRYRVQADGQSKFTYGFDGTAGYGHEDADKKAGLPPEVFTENYWDNHKGLQRKETLLGIPFWVILVQGENEPYHEEYWVNPTFGSAPVKIVTYFDDGRVTSVEPAKIEFPKAEIAASEFAK